jgi:hypothetical protein
VGRSEKLRDKLTVCFRVVFFANELDEYNTVACLWHEIVKQAEDLSAVGCYLASIRAIPCKSITCASLYAARLPSLMHSLHASFFPF